MNNAELVMYTIHAIFSLTLITVCRKDNSLFITLAKLNPNRLKLRIPFEYIKLAFNVILMYSFVASSKNKC